MQGDTKRHNNSNILSPRSNICQCTLIVHSFFTATNGNHAVVETILKQINKEKTCKLDNLVRKSWFSRPSKKRRTLKSRRFISDDNQFDRLFLRHLKWFFVVQFYLIVCAMFSCKILFTCPNWEMKHNSRCSDTISRIGNRFTSRTSRSAMVWRSCGKKHRSSL